MGILPVRFLFLSVTTVGTINFVTDPELVVCVSVEIVCESVVCGRILVILSNPLTCSDDVSRVTMTLG